jgi:non-canonical poly(A) RNA polymerase PAPD5/7
LHKEIIDFYEWVRPKEYEQEVRADVLKRLSLTFNQIDQGELKAFGSYAAGLYLPTGDMDLVFLQRTFRPGWSQANGLPPPPKRALLERFAKRLRDTGVARTGSVQLIPWAKVPIIKFVDQVTGLRIDLSFNNDTGVVANETVQKWKSQYPAMPIIVSIIKQSLMIRGLNDVAKGGLGGFSIICLVTSLIQHLPGASPPSNLGRVLLEFFNLYGNLMDKDTVALRLDPPGYIDKVCMLSRNSLVTDVSVGYLQTTSLQQREGREADDH